MNMWWRCNTCIGPDWLAIHSALMSAIVGPFAIRLPSWPSSSPVVHVLSHSTRNWFYFFYDRSSNDCDLIFVPFAVTNNILVDFGIWFATRAQIYRLLMRLIDVRFICIFFFFAILACCGLQLTDRLCHFHRTTSNYTKMLTHFGTCLMLMDSLLLFTLPYLHHFDVLALHGVSWRFFSATTKTCPTRSVWNLQNGHWLSGLCIQSAIYSFLAFASFLFTSF